MFPYFQKKFGSLHNVEEKLESAKEDLLTGLCMGTMQYLPPDRLLTPFLRSFPELNDRELQGEDFELRFWPVWKDRVGHLEGRYEIEPDWVAISSTVVLVGESKYQADFDGKQLYREWQLARHQFGGCKEVFLVGISSHSIQPDPPNSISDANWLWANWRTIPTVVHKTLGAKNVYLDPYEERLLQSLRDTLNELGIYSTYLFNTDWETVDRPEFDHAYQRESIGTGFKQDSQDSFSQIINQLPVNISAIPGGYSDDFNGS